MESVCIQLTVNDGFGIVTLTKSGFKGRILKIYEDASEDYEIGYITIEEAEKLLKECNVDIELLKKII